LVPLKPAIPSPPEQTTRPLPPKGLRKRLITVGIAATLALSLVGIIVSRQFLGASQSGSHNRPATTTVAPAPTPVPAASTPAPVQTEPAPPATPPPAAPVETTQPATDQILRDQILRDQVNPLWEAGRYAAAMRLVDSALASNPASTEARAWKKRIRAAQDAEAAMK
jgi:hypothetical protein